MTHTTTAMEAWQAVQEAVSKIAASLDWDYVGDADLRKFVTDSAQAAASVLEAWKEEQVRELRKVLRLIVTELDDGQAPRHHHRAPGIWDDDSSNGELAGKPCEWCETWNRARTLLAGERGE